MCSIIFIGRCVTPIHTLITATAYNFLMSKMQLIRMDDGKISSMIQNVRLTSIVRNKYETTECSELKITWIWCGRAEKWNHFFFFTFCVTSTSGKFHTFRINRIARRTNDGRTQSIVWIFQFNSIQLAGCVRACMCSDTFSCSHTLTLECVTTLACAHCVP